MIIAGLSGWVAACTPGNMGFEGTRVRCSLMQATERFSLLIERPPASVPLDEMAFLIAAHAHRGLDVGEQLARLDDLAARCPTPTRDGVMRHLFGNEGFQG